MSAPYRRLLRVFPESFRDEFGDELLRHWTCQRAEPRYQRPGFGAVAFWWDISRDAVRNGIELRMEARRDRRHPSNRGPSGSPPPTRGLMLDALLRDLRHAVRNLGKNPGYALVFILTLGLGIGANTAMFSAVNGVLLRPLPHNDGDRLVYLRHTAQVAGVENALFSVPEIQDYRSGISSLESVAEFSALTFTMLGHDTPRRVRAGIVTGNYFGVMGLGASMGRMVGPEDDGEGAPAIIVLSDAYWRTVFGGDVDVLGRTVEMNGLTATIVGVAEPAPPYPERTDIYVNMAASPHHLDASMNHDRIHRMTEVFARLSPGANADQVAAEAEVVSARIHADYPDAYDAGSGYGVTVTPLKTQLTSRARPTLLILFGTALLVLIIACANLANLTLTRVLRRDHELAIRVSLGSSRAALRRSLLMESLVLAAGGAALGLVMANVSLDMLIRFAGRFTSRASEISLDATVFGFALLAAVGASVFFTLLPPLPSGHGSSALLTRSGSRTIRSGARRLQRALVVGQIGTSFVLLIGAGLLVRTMMHLNRIDPGFDTTEILSMDIPKQMAPVPDGEIINYYTRVMEDVEALPGVEATAMTSVVPLSGETGFTTMMQISVEGQEPAPGTPTPRADFRVVSPGYFDLMGIEVLRGREFTSTDVKGMQDVLLINASMARAYFGDRDPIGQRIAWTDPIMRFMGEEENYRTVVGVVADTRDAGLDAPVVHAVYNAHRQITPRFTESLVVRLSTEAESLLPTIRETILAHDPNQPIVRIATIEQLGTESVAPRRLNTTLLTSFALLALVIAAVGIGGVLAFSVGSRRREFGVKSALGAASHQIWTGVLAEGFALAVAGVLIGTLAAVLLTRFVAGFLYGVPALDPVTFLTVGLLLTFVAGLAAWVPAWRAADVSPMEALNAD